MNNDNSQVVSRIRGDIVKLKADIIAKIKSGNIKEIAKRTGINRTYLSDLARGKKNTSTDQVLNLAEKFFKN